MSKAAAELDAARDIYKGSIVLLEEIRKDLDSVAHRSKPDGGASGTPAARRGGQLAGSADPGMIQRDRQS